MGENGTMLSKWAKEQGWKGNFQQTWTSGHCPECRREKPLRNYWRMRDIAEASTSFGHLSSEVVNYWGYKGSKQRRRIG